MGRIALLPLPERSHAIPTFGLARRLISRGHEVTYGVVADLVDEVRRQGFRAEALLENRFPRGTLAKTEEGPEQLREAHNSLFGGVLSDPAWRSWLADHDPDLVLGDPWAIPFALGARLDGRRVLMVSPTLPNVPDLRVPPGESPIVPTSLSACARGWIEWARVCRDGIPHRAYWRKWRDAAAATGERMTMYTWYPRITTLPELVLCPEALDLPRAKRIAGVSYSEAFVDLDRREPESFAIDRLASDRPLVVVSFGTNTHRFPELENLLRVCVEAARRCSAFEFVLNAPSALRAELERSAPPNCHVATGIPQLTLLRRAKLMIHHAGLNTVKECCTFGVASLAIPWARPINAVRIAYHGIGGMLPLEQATPASVQEAIQRLVGSEVVARAVRAMSAEFEAARTGDLGCRVVERELAPRSRSSGGARRFAGVSAE